MPFKYFQSCSLEALFSTFRSPSSGRVSIRTFSHSMAGEVALDQHPIWQITKSGEYIDFDPWIISQDCLL